MEWVVDGREEFLPPRREGERGGRDAYRQAMRRRSTTSRLVSVSTYAVLNSSTTSKRKIEMTKASSVSNGVRMGTSPTKAMRNGTSSIVYNTANADTNSHAIFQPPLGWNNCNSVRAFLLANATDVRPLPWWWLSCWGSCISNLLWFTW